MNRTTVWATRLAMAAFALFAWEWGCCRLYVPPNQMAVVTAKLGRRLPPGRVLAKPGEQGVLEDVLAEGRHFRNPIFYSCELRPVTYIPPGKAGLVTAKSGDELPPGEFLADAGQKGVRRRLLPPGRYRINPVGYDVALIDLQSVPTGFVGVVTSLSGAEPAAADGFARVGEKGVLVDVLQPGLYYVNPREYLVSVVEVGVNQVSLIGGSGGVVATKNLAVDANNDVMNRLNLEVAREQQRRREEFNTQQIVSLPVPAQAGSRLAPAQARGLPPPRPVSGPVSGFAVRQAAPRGDAGGASSLLSVGSVFGPAAAAPAEWVADAVPDREGALAYYAGRRGSGLAGPADPDAVPGYILNQTVNFPSRDGFDISLDMTLEFELLTDLIPALYRDYGDIGAVVDKIVMPQILSVSRLKGSAYHATDFIAGTGREKFQTELTESLRALLREKNLAVHTALISHVNVPPEILQPLQVSSLSRETDLTNQELQRTAARQAQLNAEMGMIQQLGEKVLQETAKIKAEIRAELDKEVAEIHAETLQQAAELEKRTAGIQGQSARLLGAAKAEAHALVETEKAKGWGMRVAAFGDPEGFALYEMAEALAPDIRISLFHAGDGTLWTDLQGARLADLDGAGQGRLNRVSME